MSKGRKKYKLNFGRGIGIHEAEDMITKLVYFAVSVFEEENFDTASAHIEANKIVFGFEHASLGGSIAQWIAKGGDETKAREAIHDYILLSKKKEEQKAGEQKVVMARVFGSK